MKLNIIDLRGGKREGAGRKRKYNKPTKTIRLPVDLAYELEQLKPEQLQKISQQLFNFRIKK